MRYFGRRNLYLSPAEKAANKAANAAAKAARAAKTATCQICARAILANTGKIAHHGYTRPGHGWQTSSCFGARFRPYEVACDALPLAIKSVEAHINRVEALLTEWLASPPAAIHCTHERGDRRSAWGDKYRVEWSVMLPVGFDPAAPVDKHNDCQAPWDYAPQPRSNYGVRPADIKIYAAVYASRIAEFRADLTGSKETRDYFAKRLAEWKPPTEN